MCVCGLAGAVRRSGGRERETEGRDQGEGPRPGADQQGEGEAHPRARLHG